MGQSLLDFKQWLLAELERKLRWRDPDRKRHSTIYKIILCKKIDLALTGACLVALSIFKSKIYPDIIYIPSVLKQKSGNWKMATIRSSSQQLKPVLRPWSFCCWFQLLQSIIFLIKIFQKRFSLEILLVFVASISSSKTFIIICPESFQEIVIPHIAEFLLNFIH